MGKRGPKPTPAGLLKIRGSWRGKSRPAEPAPVPADAPAVPMWLSHAAKAVWAELVPDMPPDVLARADANALARYCDATARWRAAAADLDQHGETFTVTSRNGTYIRPRPQVAMYHKLGAALVKLEQEFGLTPSSRGRVTPPDGGDGPPGGGGKGRLFMRPAG